MANGQLTSNVLKPGPDRTVRAKKPWTSHHHGSFMLKNRSMPKMQGTVWTAAQPHGSENRDRTASHGSLWIWTLKKKKNPKQKKKKHNSLFRETQKHNSLSKEKKKYIMFATAISRETQHVFIFLLLLSSEHITQLPLLGTLVLGEASFKF